MRTIAKVALCLWVLFAANGAYASCAAQIDQTGSVLKSTSEEAAGFFAPCNLNPYAGSVVHTTNSGSYTLTAAAELKTTALAKLTICTATLDGGGAGSITALSVDPTDSTGVPSKVLTIQVNTYKTILGLLSEPADAPFAISCL